MAPVEVPGVNIPLLTGPLVLAYMWGYGLYGVLLVQLYIYHITFRKDKIGFKIFVWSLFLLETVFTIFTTIAAWHTFGTGWGDPDALTKIDVSWEPLPALNGFIAAMVQSFYVYRIWTLTKNAWLALVIEAAWLSGSAVCDLLITASIVTILYRSKPKAVFSHTTNTVTRLIRYTVETGLLTSVVALCELILWLTNRQYNFHFIGFLILGKLYSNTLLATLNSRALMFSGHQHDHEHQSAFIATTPHNTTSYWDESEPLETDLSSVYQHQPSSSISQPVQDLKTVHIGQSADDLDAKAVVVSVREKNISIMTESDCYHLIQNLSDHSKQPSAASTSAGTFY
ncbi:hypothetical protein DFS33DRAFT_1099023 [Desarmillaria ectypa]|nr:hypothetical protein DFS33DRAFT_1099023 [Desarmillaria ectypa]